MKARELTRILNDTKYTVNNNEDYIAVGSPLCHNLISVDKKSLKLKYALDTFHQGRESIAGKSAELLFIWDKLQELIDSGEIKLIIEGNDIIENKLPVYTVSNGKLIETFTDKYGWPNTTIEGNIMYENTHFKTKAEAIQYGIEEYTAGLKFLGNRLIEAKAELQKIENYITEEQGYLNYLNKLKSEL